MFTSHCIIYGQDIIIKVLYIYEEFLRLCGQVRLSLLIEKCSSNSAYFRRVDTSDNLSHRGGGGNQNFKYL